MSELIFRPIDYRSLDPLAPVAAQLVLGKLYSTLPPSPNPTLRYAENSTYLQNFCVESDGQLVAAGSLDNRRMNQGVARLENIVVDDQMQRRYVGRFLVSQLEATAINNGGQLMRVESLKDAVGFYRKCGYEQIGNRKSTVLVKELMPESAPSRILVS